SVEKSNAGARHAVARGHQRFEMKTGIYDNLRLSQPSRKIQFTPYAQSATCKNGFATRVIAMQPFCNLQNALEVFPQGGVTGVALLAAQSLPHQVFDQNGLLPVRLVLRCLRLKIKADGRGYGRFKLRKLANFFTRDHA